MCTSSNCPHGPDPLDDDLDALLGPLDASAVPAAQAAAQTALNARTVTSTRTFEEDCDKCRGSGRFVGYTGRVRGPCFTCKGTGKRRYKTSAEDREKMRERAAAKRAEQAASKAQQGLDWLAANPVEAEWLNRPVTGDFTFHRDMLQALMQYGSLTERQEAAVRNAAAKFNAAVARKQAETTAREAGAATVDISAIREGLASALQHLKRPKLRVADIRFSLAPASGRNAGSIYVVRASTDTYLGKITEDNRFITSRECDAETEAEVLRVATDPKAAAEAHGHEYGYCSCCGRELTNPESVARGIGPICADRWGW